MNNFAELLTNARESKHMSKTEVAQYFNWTPMYYGRYENGYLKPQGTNIKKFADFIGVSVKELKNILEINNDNK